MAGKNRLVDELLLPCIKMFLSAPLTALVPVLIVSFAMAFAVSEVLTHLERRGSYYAANR